MRDIRIVIVNFNRGNDEQKFSFSVGKKIVYIEMRLKNAKSVGCQKYCNFENRLYLIDCIYIIADSA